MTVRETDAGLEFTVRVQPRAARNEVAGLHGDDLRIRLTAPPVAGAANAALVAFLADALGVRRADVAIVSGQSGRQKRIRVQGAAMAHWQRLLGAPSGQ